MMWCLSFVLFFLITFSSAEYFKECSEILEGTYIVNAYDCRSYIYCGDEKTSFMTTCPENTYFNEDKTECIFDDDNICPEVIKQEQIPPEEIRKQTKQPQHSALTSDPTNKPQKILTTGPTKPVCVGHADAYYPHYQRCEYYFRCIAGYLTILRCNLFYAWDYHREMCVPSAMAECYSSSAS